VAGGELPAGALYQMRGQRKSCTNREEHRFSGERAGLENFIVYFQPSHPQRERQNVPRQISEERARKEMIDPQLERAGWYLRDHSKVRYRNPCGWSRCRTVERGDRLLPPSAAKRESACPEQRRRAGGGI